MGFKATIREIDNAFIVDLSDISHAEYQEVSTPTFEQRIEWIVGKYKQWHPFAPVSVPVAFLKAQKVSKTPVKKRPLIEVPVATPDQTSSNVSFDELVEGAVKFTKLAGLVRKLYCDYLGTFNANFPGLTLRKS